ncbi:hypothetical protein DV872_23700 [Oceanispirochaeta sp. M1]|nr:hypothetical protein DV872_23700 [Oceanispirochaeta sp. M1]
MALRQWKLAINRFQLEYGPNFEMSRIISFMGKINTFVIRKLTGQMKFGVLLYQFIFFIMVCLLIHHYRLV